MIPSPHILRTTSVSPALIVAAVDYIAEERPDLSVSRSAVADLALALGYDCLTATVLVARIDATARLFAHPGWPAFSRWRARLPFDQAVVFRTIVLRFIATELLDADLAFDAQRLFARLLKRLSCQGSA